MCRKYTIQHQHCFHKQHYIFYCPNCPFGQGRDFTFQTIDRSIATECPDCLNLWTLQQVYFSHLAPTPLSKSESTHSIALWDGLDALEELYVKEPIPGTRPFSNGRLSVSDFQWFEVQVLFLRSSLLEPSVGRTFDQDLATVDKALRVLAYNRICGAHETYLAHRATKPAFLTPVLMEDIDENHAECPICSEEFTEAMKPVMLPCSKVHIYCSADAVSILKARGPKCSICRREFVADNYSFGEAGEQFKSVQDVVSPIWMSKFRARFD